MRWLVARLGEDPILLAILIAGCALRIAWVASANVHPMDDTLYYHQHAVDVAAGRGFLNPNNGQPTAFLPPGYSLLLGAAYWLFEPSQYVAGGLNVLVSAGIIVLTYMLARRFAGRWAGRLAAAAFAFFPALILYTNASLPDLLSTLLVLAALVLAFPKDREALKRGRLIALGAIVGIALLTAPRLGLVVPAIAVSWLAWVSWRDALRSTALVAGVAVAVVLPWTVRTFIQLDAPVLIATNDGANLWVGNNEHATGTWMSWTGAPDDSWGYPAGNEVDESNRLRNEAVRYALSHPWKTAKLWPAKYDYTFDDSFGYVAHFSLVTRTEKLPHWMDRPELENWINDPAHLVFRLGLAGIVLALLLRRDLWMLLPAIAALLLPVFIFFGLDRYQVPLLPLLMIFGAWGVTWALALVQQAFPRRAVARLFGRAY